VSGRPSKRILETYKQKLEWFKLHHYAGVRDLTAYGWYEQISFRKDLLQLAEDRKYKSDIAIELQPHEEEPQASPGEQQICKYFKLTK
jgi:hypothetical protein